MSAPDHISTSTQVRWGVRVRGTVQGVGFRPTVYRIAQAHGLTGLVRNDSGGVWIEIEGDYALVASFASALAASAPPLARIDTVEVHPMQPPSASPSTGSARQAPRFEIVSSDDDRETLARIPADSAPCPACLAELRDPRDRRYHYPFINCTACGPRYTIVLALPYDRARTTMGRFSQCEACAREYHDPSSRRFHAEPNACPACGPRLAFGQLRGDPALAAAVAALHGGEILAVRGVGGFLLAADAANAETVARLRTRKARPGKPFAVMARDLATAERIAIVDDAARTALKDPARPIVLLPARRTAGLAALISPRSDFYGVMLPPTPLHQLLADDGPAVQVMTSGNRANEPIAIDDDDAIRQLAGIADGILTHDRPIHTRVDDSVVRIVAGEPQPVRRARGFVPQPIGLPVTDGRPLLAVGGELKSTVCLVRKDDAFVSPHLGDLTSPATLALFDETISKLSRLLGVEPARVAHDLHPDYHSTAWARARGLPCVAVQHHHAHVAACLAEHGRTGPTIGVAFDGTGCGPDGALWGGEWLLADLGGFRRVGHLRPLRLPGGEAAIRQPWRVALAALVDADEPLDLLGRIAPAERARVARLVASGIAAPEATGAGRWFDAVASLCGLVDEATYEAEGAAALEGLALGVDAAPYPFAIEDAPTAPHVVDLRPTIARVARDLRAGISTRLVAAAFHETLVEAVVRGCRLTRARSRIGVVALSGGCFQNARLSERTAARLKEEGFEVLLHRRVPPNDGGLSLGQAAVAAFRAGRGRL
jgi:hydrogenase maturation protein HypF